MSAAFWLGMATEALIAGCIGKHQGHPMASESLLIVAVLFYIVAAIAGLLK